MFGEDLEEVSKTWYFIQLLRIVKLIKNAVSLWLNLNLNQREVEGRVPVVLHRSLRWYSRVYLY